MAENMSLWLTPLLIMPGVGLLVISTSARYGQIHLEIQRLTSLGSGSPIVENAHLVMRARLFRDALVALYTCASVLVLGSLLGGLTHSWTDLSRWIIITLTGLGILSFFWATVQLIRESIKSLEIICEYGRQLPDPLDGQDKT